MKPSATHQWLVAAVMAVLWAIATTLLWALLALAFGRSKSDMRLISVLVVGAVLAAFFCVTPIEKAGKAAARRASGGAKI